jgi:hypothetical protein
LFAYPLCAQDTQTNDAIKVVELLEKEVQKLKLQLETQKAQKKNMELFKIALTSSLTVLGGVVVFVLGQIIAKFFIEPIHEQFRVIGEIADLLIFYADLYSNPGDSNPERREEASKMLRKQASQLMARTSTIRLYKLWQFLEFVRKHADIMEAHKHLIGLSNCIFIPPNSGLREGLSKIIENNYNSRKKIEKCLRIKTYGE